jgi:hypothetical protein
MIISGRDKNASRFERLLVLYIDNAERSAVLKKRREKIIRMLCTMLHDDDGNLEICRHGRKDARESAQSAP